MTERQGIKAAKESGKYLGRKTVITKRLIDEGKDLKENKKLSISKIAKVTGKGRTTIYKILKKELNYIPYNRLVKEISVQEFTSSLNNQQKTNIKKYFIEAVKLFEKHDLIESNYQVIVDGILQQAPELTTRKISQAFFIYEKFSI